MDKWVPAVAKTRGDYVEMLHSGGAIAVTSEGETLFELGQTGDCRTFFRSSAKPFQAQAMPAEVAAKLSGEEMALAVASHNGEEGHTKVAESMLAKFGLTTTALRCGTHEPYAGSRALAEGKVAGPEHNNCSGKHAAMLATCVARGWPLETYQAHDHPLQVEIRQHLRAAAGIGKEEKELEWAVDGCGVPTYHLSLRQMATAFSKLSLPQFEATRRAMDKHSWCVAGTGEFDTLLPVVTGGRLVTKRGGGAVQCVNVGNIGICVKVADGSSNVKEQMMMRVLEILKLLTPEETSKLSEFAGPKPLLNVAGKQIGEQKVLF